MAATATNYAGMDVPDAIARSGWRGTAADEHGNVQDAALGAVLADYLDEQGLPHGPLFRNLAHSCSAAGGNVVWSTPEGEFRAGENRSWAAGLHDAAFHLTPLVGPAGTRIAATRIPDSGGVHTAVMDEAALRQWAAHPNASNAPDDFRRHILAAADYLAGRNAPPAGAPPTQASRYERRHAPKGGLNFREKPYRSGQFVPGDLMFQHAPKRTEYGDVGSPSSGSEGHPVRGTTHAEEVARALPPAAHERLKTRVLQYTPVDSVEEATRRWYSGMQNPPPAHQQTPVIAFYDPATGELVSAPGGPNVDAKGALAHEVFHALDQDDDRKYFDLSGHPDWHRAWNAEMSRGQLSPYGATDEQEGFAELGRYALTHGPQAAAEKFPLGVAYLSRLGLI